MRDGLDEFMDEMICDESEYIKKLISLSNMKIKDIVDLLYTSERTFQRARSVGFKNNLKMKDDFFALMEKEILNEKYSKLNYEHIELFKKFDLIDKNMSRCTVALLNIFYSVYMDRNKGIENRNNQISNEALNVNELKILLEDFSIENLYLLAEEWDLLFNLRFNEWEFIEKFYSINDVEQDKINEYLSKLVHPYLVLKTYIESDFQQLYEAFVKYDEYIKSNITKSQREASFERKIEEDRSSFLKVIIKKYNKSVSDYREESFRFMNMMPILSKVNSNISDPLLKIRFINMECNQNSTILTYKDIIFELLTMYSKEFYK